MNNEEVRKQICNAILVTHQNVAIAEAFILKSLGDDTGRIISQFSGAMDSSIPEKVELEEVTIDKTIREVARALSWRLAAAEAVWRLIHAGVCMAASEHASCVLPIISWRDNGRSSGWQFPEFQIAVPTMIRIAPSAMSSRQQPLANADLYLQELDIPGFDSEVEDALREGVSCFRHGLYLACLAMLGKACEGAWYELGVALVGALPDSEIEHGSKIIDTLNNRNSSIPKKIEAVINLYDHKQSFRMIISATGIKQNDLRSVAVWSDVVRDSRNAVHYGREPAMGNTYEKVAALLMGAVPNLRIIYRVKAALGSKGK